MQTKSLTEPPCLKEFQSLLLHQDMSLFSTSESPSLKAGTGGISDKDFERNREPWINIKNKHQCSTHYGHNFWLRFTIFSFLLLTLSHIDIFYTCSTQKKASQDAPFLMVEQDCSTSEHYVLCQLPKTLWLMTSDDIWWPLVKVVNTAGREERRIVWAQTCAEQDCFTSGMMQGIWKRVQHQASWQTFRISPPNLVSPSHHQDVSWSTNLPKFSDDLFKLVQINTHAKDPQRA